MKLKTQLIFTTFLLTVICILFGACDREDWYADRNLLLTDEMHGSLRNGNVVTTGGVKDVTFNSATILFSANYNYKESIEIEPGIIYSDVKFNPSYYSQIEKATYVKVSNFANSALEITLDNLKPNTTYYYCAYAKTKYETSYGYVGTFTTEATYSPGDAVDLGLSVKWASYNVGAACPENDGVKFYWGGTKPTSEAYSADWHDFSLSTLKSQGYIDNNENLCSTYDAATQMWGSKWRMPTQSEFQELIDKCSWMQTIKNGKEVYLVTGPNGNVIYMPDNDDYWSSTASGGQAYYLNFYSPFIDYIERRFYCLSKAYRSTPHHIRPVSKY